MRKIKRMQLISVLKDIKVGLLIAWRDGFLGQNSDNEKLKAIDSGIYFIVKFTYF